MSMKLSGSMDLTSSYPKKTLGVGLFLKSRTNTEGPSNENKCSPDSAATAFSNTPQSSNRHILHFELLPQTTLFRIFSFSGPNLRQMRQVSRSMRIVTDSFIQETAKKFKEMREESECWGNKAPQLYEILHLDPLVLDLIIHVVYDPKMKAVQEQAITRVDTNNLISQYQKLFMKAYETGLKFYSKLWYSIPPIRQAINRYQLQYNEITSSTQSLASTPIMPSVLIDSTESITTALANPTIQQQSTVNDPLPSPISKYEEEGKLMGYNSQEIPQLDSLWTSMNDTLFGFSCLYGHLQNTPPISQLTQAKVNFIIGKCIVPIIKQRRLDILSFLIDQLTEYMYIADKTLSIAMNTALAHYTDKIDPNSFNRDRYQKAQYKTTITLLNIVFNDKRFANLTSTSSLRQKGWNLASNQCIPWSYCQEEQKYIVRSHQRY